MVGNKDPYYDLWWSRPCIFDIVCYFIFYLFDTAPLCILCGAFRFITWISFPLSYLYILVEIISLYFGPSHKNPTAKIQLPPKYLHGNTFWEFWCLEIVWSRKICLVKFVCDIIKNPNSPQADKLFFPNLYKLYNLYIIMDGYLVLLTR